MLVKSQLLTLTNKKGHRLTKTVPSGGGGDHDTPFRVFRKVFSAKELWVYSETQAPGFVK